MLSSGIVVLKYKPSSSGTDGSEDQSRHASGNINLNQNS
jgi:hypothetical protein